MLTDEQREELELLTRGNLVDDVERFVCDLIAEAKAEAWEKSKSTTAEAISDVVDGYEIAIRYALESVKNPYRSPDSDPQDGL